MSQSKHDKFGRYPSGRVFRSIFFKASLRYLHPKNILVSIVSKKDAATTPNAKA